MSSTLEQDLLLSQTQNQILFVTNPFLSSHDNVTDFWAHKAPRQWLIHNSIQYWFYQVLILWILLQGGILRNLNIKNISGSYVNNAFYIYMYVCVCIYIYIYIYIYLHIKINVSTEICHCFNEILHLEQ